MKGVTSKQPLPRGDPGTWGSVGMRDSCDKLRWVTNGLWGSVPHLYLIPLLHVYSTLGLVNAK
jgi:hypothetical protein